MRHSWFIVLAALVVATLAGGVTPQSASASPAAQGGCVSWVSAQAGDTLISLAWAYGLTLEQIRGWNPGISILRTGQYVCVSAQTTVTAYGRVYWTGPAGTYVVSGWSTYYWPGGRYFTLGQYVTLTLNEAGGLIGVK